MLPKYSLGVGDRFGRQATAQLEACILALHAGVEVVPVWNKSNREHVTIGSGPGSVRAAADAAVSALGWMLPYYVDADHIRIDTVDRFLPASDFFTIDVADSIGELVSPSDIDAFTGRHPELIEPIRVPGHDEPMALSLAALRAAAEKYLASVQEAGRIYRHIAERKNGGAFVTEVSMDETDSPQTPPELLVILAAISDERIPIETIAPKFTGRFNKGVDYVGDVSQFEQELRADVAMLAHAVERYGLPAGLKLSVHSGSDKFAIYPAVARTLRATGAGIHVKTAGTTWLEEVIGLAESDGDGLALAKDIYSSAHSRSDELCAPYSAVIDIDAAALPTPSDVARWTGDQFAAALRHNRSDPRYNPSFRQLIHVAYKIAAQMGDRYLQLVDVCEPTIARNVTYNLFERHIKPIFLAGAPA